MLARLQQNTATAAPVPRATFGVDRDTNTLLDFLHRNKASEYKGSGTICADPVAILSRLGLLDGFGRPVGQQASLAILLQLPWPVALAAMSVFAWFKACTACAAGTAGGGVCGGQLRVTPAGRSDHSELSTRHHDLESDPRLKVSFNKDNNKVNK